MLAPQYADAKQYVVEKRSFGEVTFRLVNGYTFESEGNKVIFQKLRYEGSGEKTFRYRWYDGRAETWRNEKPRGIKRGSVDADTYLYRMCNVLNAAKSGGPLVWCEGEKDADTIWAHDSLLGETEALSTSHHGGAGKVYAEQAAWCVGVSKVYLCLDLDVPGYYDALLRYEGLKAVGVPAVFRAPRVGKDITDHLEAGYELTDWRRVSMNEVLRYANQYTESVGVAHGYGK